MTIIDRLLRACATGHFASGGRTPAKTKQELREMLAQAVRNTQPETETKPLPKTKKGRR